MSSRNGFGQVFLEEDRSVVVVVVVSVVADIDKSELCVSLDVRSQCGLDVRVFRGVVPSLRDPRADDQEDNGEQKHKPSSG